MGLTNSEIAQRQNGVQAAIQKSMRQLVADLTALDLPFEDMHNFFTGWEHVPLDRILFPFLMEGPTSENPDA